MHCQARIAHSFDQLPNGSRYAPHAATRQSAGYCVSTPAERADVRCMLCWAVSRLGI